MDRFTAMQAFVKVVESGSFSAAARQLRLGQPAISKTVAQLEKYVGSKLLVRTTRRLSATEAGMRFYEHAKAALAEAEEAELAAKGAGSGLSGRLRISAPVTFTRILVMPHLPKFLAQHPKLEIEMLLDDRNVDLVGEGIDLAIRLGTISDMSAVVQKIGIFERGVFASPAYLARAGIPLSPSELPGHEGIIYMVRGGGSAWSFRKGSTEQSVRLAGQFRTTAAEALREAVIAGVGIAITTERMFSEELQAGSVQQVLRDWSLLPIDGWVVFPGGRKPSAKARAFATFVKTLFFVGAELSAEAENQG